MEEARFELRHGTQDLEVFKDVVSDNQYRLADKLPPDCLVIDVGANIGCFAVACLLRGAGMVVCLEPSHENFGQLGNNLLSWPGRAVAFNTAVWRSDAEQEVSFTTIGGGTAAGCCFPSELEIPEQKASRVNTIGLDEMILHCTNDGGRRVQLLKIDAEYSEYPILYSSKRLDLVDEIVGEAHEFVEKFAEDKYYRCTGYQNTAADLCRFLGDQGFTVTTARESFANQTNTLFFAKRTPTPETV